MMDSTVEKSTSLKENVTYGLSEVACIPIYTIMMAFLVYFYTDVIGLNAGIVGTIILVSKVFDGISDVIAGNIVDHTHTKAGSARPWYLRLAIPIAFSYIILFTVPNWGTAGKVAYIFISYNLVATVIYTMMNAAMSALPTFMTKNRNSRSVMMSIRLFIGGVVQMGLLLFMLQFVEKLGGGQSGWVKLSAILGAVAAIVLIFIYFNTKEISEGDQVNSKETDVPLLTALKALLKNKYWLLCLLMYFIGIVSQVATLTVGVYYAKYVLNDAKLFTNLTLYFYPATLLAMFFMPFLLGKGVSKRNLAAIGSVMVIAGSVVCMISSNGMFFIIALMLRGIGMGASSSVMMGMILETIVYGEWKTGYNIPSVTVTANCMGQKIGSGLGTAGLGAVLAICGYDGMAQVQPPMAVAAIDFIYVVVPAILSVILLICLYFFKLDKDYPRYVAELKERKKATNHERTVKEVPGE